MYNIEDVLKTRQETHGSFMTTSFLAQDLKRLIHSQFLWCNLSFDKREALDMIATKIARIINGDQDFKDHWEDIEGYANLISRKLENH